MSEKKPESPVYLGLLSCQSKRQSQNKARAAKISECCMDLFLKKNLSVTLYMFYHSREWSGAGCDVRLRGVEETRKETESHLEKETNKQMNEIFFFFTFEKVLHGQISLRNATYMLSLSLWKFNVYSKLKSQEILVKKPNRFPGSNIVFKQSGLIFLFFCLFITNETISCRA